jgi:hypothetical protein
MKNLSIKQRLLSLTIILVLLIAGLSVFFNNRFRAMAETYQQIPQMHVPQQLVASELIQMLASQHMLIASLNSIDRDSNAFETIAKQSEKNMEQFNMMKNAFLNGASDLGTAVEQLKGVAVPALERNSEIETLVKNIDGQFKAYKAVCDKIIAKKREQLEFVNTIGWYESETESKGMMKSVAQIRLKMKESIKEFTLSYVIDEIAGYEKSVLNNPEAAAVTKFKELIASSMPMFDTLNKGLEENQQPGENPLKKYQAEITPVLDKLFVLKTVNDELKTLAGNDLNNSNKTLNQAVQRIKENTRTEIVTAAANAKQMEGTAKTIILVISIITIAFGLVFGWLVSSAINKKLLQVVQSIGDSSEQVASASTQVSSSSQSMSEGSSEQAAAIEETSSSLEEMSSMTKQNADNANQADQLMKSSNQIVLEANSSMNNLIKSMEEISMASEQTFKIIKTIDEIAFQTNLLALNAAVEAARAGEAGAGFAVVADEVRNLAMRAAEAAKNTSTLIEGTVKKIKEGSALVSRSNTAFTHVSESSVKVGELVAEIAAASKEQAQGIEQVNKAVNEMDKVVQQNAATSEETASASEEMSAQAEQMKFMVKEMMLLIGGAKQNGNGNGHQKSHKRSYMPVGYDARAVVAVRRKKNGNNGNGEKIAPYKTDHEINPEQIIPLNDDELHAF